VRLALLGVLLAAGTAAAQPLDRDDFRGADPARSAVRVITEHGAGSGTVVGRRGKTALVLTNQHVMPRPQDVWVVAGRERAEGRFVAANAGPADLALLEADVDAPALGLGDAEPAVGSKVTHYGVATGPESGEVREVIRLGDYGPTTVSDMLSVPGDSGGAVVQDGRLVGVTFGRSGTVREKKHLAVRLAEVREFLRRVAPGVVKEK
jgi:S1-C subfamily serine protease